MVLTMGAPMSAKVSAPSTKLAPSVTSFRPVSLASQRPASSPLAIAAPQSVVTTVQTHSDGSTLQLVSNLSSHLTKLARPAPPATLTRVAPTLARAPGGGVAARSTQDPRLPGYLSSGPFGGPKTVVAAPPSADIPGVTPDPGTASPTVDGGASDMTAGADASGGDAPSPVSAAAQPGETSTGSVPTWAIAVGAGLAAVTGYLLVSHLRR